jgi:octaprenyl-diphosphate synthase
MRRWVRVRPVAPLRSSILRGPRLDPELLLEDFRIRLQNLDQTVRDLAGGDGAPPGFDPDRFLAPGVPRVRPLLVLLSARAASAPDRGDDPTEVAAAVELVHLAILVHDAALGRRDGLRRRAARRLLGGAVGLLGGNHLTLRALELARHAPAPEVIGDLIDTLREVANGQALNAHIQGRAPTEPECMAHAEEHTGAVFSFACRAGARVGKGQRTVVAELGRYGRHAGVAWQIAEDLALVANAGSEGDDEALALLSAMAEGGRPLLPIGLAAARDPKVAEAWKRLSRRSSPELTREVANRAAETGALTDARARLAQEAWSARRALETIPESPYRQSLDRLVAGLSERPAVSVTHG